MRLLLLLAGVAIGCNAFSFFDLVEEQWKSFKVSFKTKMLSLLCSALRAAESIECKFQFVENDVFSTFSVVSKLL